MGISLFYFDTKLMRPHHKISIFKKIHFWHRNWAFSVQNNCGILTTEKNCDTLISQNGFDSLIFYWCTLMVWNDCGTLMTKKWYEKCYKTSSLSYFRVKCLVVFMSYLAPAACNLNDVCNKNWTLVACRWTSSCRLIAECFSWCW